MIDSFALFRYPGQSDIHLIEGEAIHISKLDSLANAKTLFVISAFNMGTECTAILPKNTSTNPGELSGKNLPVHYAELKDEVDETKSQSVYMNIVEQAKKAFQSDQTFSKVVLSTIRTIHIEINLFDYFNTLQTAFPTAFVYLISTPQTGTWLGATPETLLTGTTRELNTVSLAGTLPANYTGTWGNKEIIEQRLVTDYISNKLTRLNLEFAINGPEELQAGTLKHIQTRFNIKPSQSFAGTIQSVVAHLNPTPAVAGMPLEKSVQLISQLEKHNRKYYTGFIGTIQEEHCQLYVNLRCLEAGKSSVRLYAGAGITIDSDPRKEWEETQRKMDIAGIGLH